MFNRKNPHFWGNIGITFLLIFVVCGLFWKLNKPSQNADEKSEQAISSKVKKIKKKTGLKIYPVKITSVKSKHVGQSDDFGITVEGKTDAPDGSIVYAQHDDGSNLAYGTGTDDGDGDYKVKKHKVKFLFLASHIFNDIDSIEVGQKSKFRVFCTNQKFSEWEQFNGKDSEHISRKVIKKANEAGIKPYVFKVSKKMEYIENHY